MKALRTVGRALLIALFLATVTLGDGLLVVRWGSQRRHKGTALAGHRPNEAVQPEVA